MAHGPYQPIVKLFGGVAAGPHNLTNDNDDTLHTTRCRIPYTPTTHTGHQTTRSSIHQDASPPRALPRDHRGLQALGEERRHSLALPRRIRAGGTRLEWCTDRGGPGGHREGPPQGCEGSTEVRKVRINSMEFPILYPRDYKCLVPGRSTAGSPANTSSVYYRWWRRNTFAPHKGLSSASNRLTHHIGTTNTTRTTARRTRSDDLLLFRLRACDDGRSKLWREDQLAGGAICFLDIFALQRRQDLTAAIQAVEEMHR
jgi:hypothetical protein